MERGEWAGKGGRIREIIAKDACPVKRAALTEAADVDSVKNRIANFPTHRSFTVSVIDDLLALQAKDKVIHDLKSNISDIPKRRAMEEENLQYFLSQIASNNAQIENGEARLRSLAEEIESLRGSIARMEEQRQTLHNMTEITAMSRQIAQAQDKLADNEERYRQAQSFVETARTNVQEAEVNCEKERTQIAASIQELNRRLVECQHLLQDAEAERAELVKTLDTAATRKFLSYYERLGRKFFPVVENIPTGCTACPGCHMSLTASKIQEAQRNTMLADDPARMRIVACDYCGRILYR